MRELRCSFDRRRILYVVNTDWFFLSHRLPVALAARDRGADVSVLARNTGAAAEIERHGFRFVPLPLSRSGTNPLSEARAVASLVGAYRRLQPDLVHHVTLKAIAYGTVAARWTRAPAVVNAVTGLGYAFVESGGRAIPRVAATVLLRSACRHKNQYLILQNPADREFFIERGWVDPGRAALILGSGVDCDRFAHVPEPEAPPYVVAMAARMLWDKGVGDFVAAARTLRRAYRSDVRCVLIGEPDPGNPSAIPESRLREWHQEGVVEWWGPEEDMPSVLARCHVLVVPTRYREGVPKILLEAAASGRPVVTTDVPGCRDAVADGETGLLVPPAVPNRLAEKVGQLLEDETLRQRLGEAARRRAEREFAIGLVVSRTLAVYEKLFKVSRSPAAPAPRSSRLREAVPSARPRGSALI